MNAPNTYYKLAAFEAIDNLWYTFYYQGYDANYPVLQESAGALGMIGTRLICNIAFENRDDTQAKIAHVLLPIIVGFGLYFITAKEGTTLQKCLYNYSTRMLFQTFQSLLYFTPQKTVEEKIEEHCPKLILNAFPYLKEKEKIGAIIYEPFKAAPLEKPKGLPTGWVVSAASTFLNASLKKATAALIARVAKHIVAEKVDLFVASILGNFAAHYTAPLIKQLPVFSSFFASERPSKMIPMRLAGLAFATAIKEDIERSLWTSDT